MVRLFRALLRLERWLIRRSRRFDQVRRQRLLDSLDRMDQLLDQIRET